MNPERAIAKLLASLCALLAACDPSAPEPKGPPAQKAAAAYVGSDVCRECHSESFGAWQGSHHDRAMETASEASVYGNFDDARFESEGGAWHFFRQDGDFFARTPSSEGQQHNLKIEYTFGVDPLQQYLVSQGSGRFQALTVAWDTRAKESGGQRWFDLREEAPPPGDALHWTGSANRWNQMCAACHSTNLEKNFDLEQTTYATTWSEIDVACEACHGPASGHVDLARDASSTPAALREGLVPLSDPADPRWEIQADTGIAVRDPPLDRHREIEVCAPCHSRRSQIGEAPVGSPFLDHYRPSLLEEGLYFADGQIQDEVYVYGSFLQSKMYAAGVSCGDCHDPHSLELRNDGDALCGQCHAADRFAVPSHHHHPEKSPGARCVSCHMPARTYMVVDDRRDHSFRVPRPDLSEDFGTPNACENCHPGRGKEWAAATLRSWFGEPEPRARKIAHTLHEARVGAPGADRLLRELSTLAEIPGIARATAVAALANYPSPETAETLSSVATDPDPLVRAAVATAAEGLPAEVRGRRIHRLLKDPRRVVRIEAARALADVSSAELPEGSRRAHESALAEYRAAQRLNSDEPASHVNLGLLAQRTGKFREAERNYRVALDLGDYFVPAHVNLADLYRASGRDTEAEEVLARAVEAVPDSAEIRHALGLTYVRLRRRDEALAELARASELAPGTPRFTYVYGVALHSYGRPDEAVAHLEKAHRRHPTDTTILRTLVEFLAGAGRNEASQAYARKLEGLMSTYR